MVLKHVDIEASEDMVGLPEIRSVPQGEVGRKEYRSARILMKIAPIYGSKAMEENKLSGKSG